MSWGLGLLLLFAHIFEVGVHVELLALSLSFCHLNNRLWCANGWVRWITTKIYGTLHSLLNKLSMWPGLLTLTEINRLVLIHLLAIFKLLLVGA